ncbi:MAG: hypothetical protein AAGU23_08370, partial [Bacillota bacterium]
MDQADMREIILDAINNKGLKSFTFECIMKLIETECKEKGNIDFSFEEFPDYEYMLTEVVRDLVIERVISTVP